jgi:hypothetical protein
MVTNSTQWAVTCTHVSGGVGVSEGTGMRAFALAGIAVRKPATVDARYDAQGAPQAWSPPV